ncbi:uncharacterized protein TNCV_2445851 [Trichonephila clavipes]|nr:uncharacterized protein TNCV_2445851 [Trichonephila clavipes]
MPPRRNKEKFHQDTEFKREEDYRPSRRRIFLSRNRSSCAAEQFHSDTSLEAVDRRAPNNSKNWQRTTEESPSRQTIDGCVCSGLMSTEPGKLIGTKLSFQMNHASLCGTMMAVFELNAMPVNAVFQSALSNVIVTEYPELSSGMRFRIMEDLSC